jgi:hypothetical protein
MVIGLSEGKRNATQVAQVLAFDSRGDSAPHFPRDHLQ